MKTYKQSIIKSLSFRIMLAMSAIGFLTGVVLYIFVLRSISDFAETHMRGDLLEKSHDIYAVCDRGLNELLKTGQGGDGPVARITKGLTIGEIEDLMRQNHLEGSVRENGRRLLLTGGFPPELSEISEKDIKENMPLSMGYGDKRYYANHLHFSPWNWHIILIKDRAEYSAMLKKVRLAYIATGATFLLMTLLSFYIFSRYIKSPVNNIIDTIKARKKPEYKGIYEFEFLSDNIRQVMESLQRETEMINNLYHIAVHRRGKEFFDEVTLAINRLFSLNSVIARVNPVGESTGVIAMFFEGDIEKDIQITQRCLPIGDAVTKKQMVVVESGASVQFPGAEVLQSVQADSYIGLPVFDRKGDIIGTVSAFGIHREFSETDIKVFQTLGEIVSSEFERLDKEEEERQIREHLFQSQKMDAIGTLAGGIAHDFNNMLQGILGYASILKMKLNEHDPNRKYVDVIEDSAVKAGELTKQLLGFARKGKYVMQPMELNANVNNVLQIITRTFDRVIEIKTDLDKGLWVIEGDQSQIENVILNLCLNARDAISAGGTLMIETFNREIRENEITDAPGRSGRFVVLRVQDTGSGISEDLRKRIFEPFFTTKEKGKGTGMGLAMVYGVIQNHDGFITVESSPGLGTGFSVFLPATEHLPEKINKELRDTPAGIGTILVVDDEETVRNFTKETLESLGYNILLAADGYEALGIFNLSKEDIDLVILDLIMPKMSGDEVFHRMKLEDPDVNVLISSGYGIEEQTKGMMKDTGISGFLHKPYNISEIAEAVKMALSAA